MGICKSKKKLNIKNSDKNSESESNNKNNVKNPESESSSEENYQKYKSVLKKSDNKNVNLSAIDLNKNNNEVSYTKNSYLNKFDEKLLKINVIYFEEIISDENYHFFLLLKRRCNGIFIAINSYFIFEQIIFKLNLDSFFFILICSGSIAQKYLKNNDSIMKKFKNIIIFCFRKDYYLSIFQEKNIYVENSIENVFKQLYVLSFEYKWNGNFFHPFTFNFFLGTPINFYLDLNLKDKYKPSKFITLQDFLDNEKIYLNEILKYYPIDYNNKPNLSIESKNNLIKCLQSNDKVERTEFLIKKIEKIYSQSKEEMPKNIIITYTSETGIVYLVNKYLRECEMENYQQISGYVSSLIYSMEYLLNKNIIYGVYRNVTLYRGIMLKISDLCLYSFSINKIVCFPSFTSTSIRKNEINAFPTDMAKKINELDNQYCVIMKIDYVYQEGNYSPAFDISRINPKEAEFLFPPFSFFKIKKVDINKGTPEEPSIICLDVPNIKFNFYQSFKKGKEIFYDSYNNEIMI